MGPAPASADQLIQEAAAGRRLTAGELRFVLEHVAQAGFVPGASTPASGLSGAVWQGRTLRGRDRITAAEYHYLDHVVNREEWPAGTSLDGYIGSIQAAVLSPDSGVVVNHFYEQLQLSVTGRSGAFRGRGEFDWILVEFRSSIGHWVTAFQPRAGLEVFNDPNRSGLRWLRPQR